MSGDRGSPLLSVRALSVEGSDGRPVEDVTFDLGSGEVLGIVGESGSGKTMAMRALLGLLPQGQPWQVSGSARFLGRDLLELPSRELQGVRGKEIAMIFQNPRTALNPVHTVGAQIAEALTAHGRAPARSPVGAAVGGLLRQVGVPDPTRRARQFPHEFSGGMAQRAVIAMALANQPKLIIADEPTTALDVTIQAQILGLLQDLREKTNASLILVSHNLALVADVADRVAVMYGGRIVESGRVADLFHHPRHPYTLGLLRSFPSLRRRARRLHAISGQPPDVGARPPGCAFHPRCEMAQDVCSRAVPSLAEIDELQQHRSACHFWWDVPQVDNGRR